MDRLELPTLYHKGKSGKLYSWLVWSENGEVHTDYGIIDGKRQESMKKCEPKNEGKSNATTPEEQAELEAKSLWTNKLERKYRQTKEEAKSDQLQIPMLAHKFEGAKKNKIKYPVTVQPKLDGLRCIADRDEDGKVILLSRNGKTYNCPHIAKELDHILLEGFVLDGELYTHGLPLQTITSYVKRLQPETEQIHYCVYDMPLYFGRMEKWSERIKWLAKLAKYSVNRHYVKIINGVECNSEEEVLAAERMFVSKGYEGAIVRSHDGEYMWGYRSSDLLKVKSFQDAEFEVIGYKDGVGKCEGAVTWRCKTNDNKEFDVVPIGTMEQRRDWFTNGDQYVGQKLKVKFFNYTPDGIPFHPSGVAFRLEEDM